MNVSVRKIAVSVEQVLHEGGPAPDRPLTVGVAAAVVENPFAGHYEPNLLEFIAPLRELGRTLATRLQRGNRRGGWRTRTRRRHRQAVDDLMATGGRIHARIGGLAAADVIGEDGLR